METKITKKTTVLFALLFVLASFGIYAQHNANDTLLIRKQRLDVLMKESSFIFEGKLISAKEFKGANDKMYFSNIFEIQHIIVGNLQKGTVEIISEAAYKSDAVTIGRDKKSNPIYNGTSLFFCKEAETVANNSKVAATNSKQLSVVDGTAFSEDKITQHSQFSAFNYFSSVIQVYEFLKENYKINIDKSLLEKKSPKISTVNKSHSDWVKNIQKRKHSNINSKNSSAGCTELYISEYLDGQGNNKSIEIYNPTSASINLNGYSILIYHGSSYSATTIALTGTITAFGTHVVSKNNASSAILAKTNQTSNNLNFNGDEIIVLNKATIHIDKIGIIGTAIGSGGWTLTPTGSTVNTDLRRKYNISQGDTNWVNCKSEWSVLPNDSIHDLGQHSNICGVDPDLDINLVNPQIIGNTFQFDVTATSTGADTYLDNAPIELTYNSAAFGTHAAANGRITVTLGSAFTTSPHNGTYLNPQNGIGDGVDSVYISFSTDPNAGSWNRVLITSTPIVILHYSFQIVNCGNTADIQFFNQFFASNFTWYYANYNDDPTNINNPQLSYTNVNYGSSLNTSIPSCMNITDFPSPVLAGVGNTVTIIGNGFGATRGTGQVKFQNADDGGTSSLLGLNDNDYINWSNTQIQIKLPSFIDTIATNGAFILGGGNFVVTNNSGQSVTSGNNMAGNPFDIYFNLAQVRNFTAPNNKDRINLRSTDTSGGYTLRLNPTDFPVGSAQRIVFTRAVQDWRCLTGANINIGKDTTVTSFVDTLNDGVNYIFFAPSTTFLGLTTRHPNTCNIDVASLTEADIQFTSSLPFTYDTTHANNIPSGKYDFYEIALHELGHFIGLEHNNELSNLMYWTPTTGNTSAQRKLLVVGTSPVDGGNYSVTHSMSSLSGGLCWPAMTTGSCSRPTGIEKYLTNNFFINLYPNPTNESIIYMDFQAPINTEAQVVVYDMMGRAVYANNLSNRNEINSTYSLDVSNLSSGMYMVNLIIDKVKVCQKFVKQ